VKSAARNRAAVRPPVVFYGEGAFARVCVRVGKPQSAACDALAMPGGRLATVAASWNACAQSTVHKRP